MKGSLSDCHRKLSALLWAREVFKQIDKEKLPTEGAWWTARRLQNWPKGLMKPQRDKNFLN